MVVRHQQVGHREQGGVPGGEDNEGGGCCCCCGQGSLKVPKMEFFIKLKFEI